jgi:maltooligosyltrehalose synthase
MAFARVLDDQYCVTIAARLTGEMPTADMAAWWRDTFVKVPLSSGSTEWTSQIIRGTVALREGAVDLAVALDKLPVAVLMN